MENLRPGYPAAWLMYLSQLQPVQYEAGTLVVAAPDERCRFVCERRLQRLIDQEMTLTTGRAVKTSYVLQDGGVIC